MSNKFLQRGKRNRREGFASLRTPSYGPGCESLRSFENNAWQTDSWKPGSRERVQLSTVFRCISFVRSEIRGKDKKDWTVHITSWRTKT